MYNSESLRACLLIRWLPPTCEIGRLPKWTRAWLMRGVSYPIGFTTAREWPLFELRAYRLDDRRYRLHLSTDLLIADARSFQILHRELLHSTAIRIPQAFPPLSISFRDYVLAERAAEETELYRRARASWLERIPALPPPPELPLAGDPARLVAAHLRPPRRFLGCGGMVRAESAAARMKQHLLARCARHSPKCSRPGARRHGLL